MNFRRYPAPGRLMTLADVQAEMDAPPPPEREWLVRTLVPRREVMVLARVASAARVIGAVLLSTTQDRVVAREASAPRIEEVQETRLLSAGVA